MLEQQCATSVHHVQAIVLPTPTTWRQITINATANAVLLASPGATINAQVGRYYFSVSNV